MRKVRADSVRTDAHPELSGPVGLRYAQVDVLTGVPARRPDDLLPDERVGPPIRTGRPCRSAKLPAVSSRPEIAPRSVGSAVDVTLIDHLGRELDMGTRVNAGPEESNGACYTDAPGLSDRARTNRATLGASLSAAGSVNYGTEWWHWPYGDRYWAFRTEQPTALYGPVELPQQRRTTRLRRLRGDLLTLEGRWDTPGPTGPSTTPPAATSGGSGTRRKACSSSTHRCPWEAGRWMSAAVPVRWSPSCRCSATPSMASTSPRAPSRVRARSTPRRRGCAGCAGPSSTTIRPALP